MKKILFIALGLSLSLSAVAEPASQKYFDAILESDALEMLRMREGHMEIVGLTQTEDVSSERCVGCYGFELSYYASPERSTVKKSHFFTRETHFNRDLSRTGTNILVYNR